VLRRIAAVHLVTVAALTGGVLLGGRWWAASALVWLAALAAAVVSLPAEGLRDRAASSAPLVAAVGIPLCVGLGLLASPRVRPAAAVAVTGLAAAGLLAAWAALLPAGAWIQRGRAAPPHPVAAGRWRLVPGVAVVAAGATVAAAVPVGVDRLVEARLADRVAPCPAMRPYAGGEAPLGLRRELAAACDLQLGGGPVTSSRGGGVALTYFRPDPDIDPRGVELAASALTHHREVLGPSAITSVSVLPVPLGGRVRGMAGPGYVLVHPAELVDPTACGSFRRTAGAKGRCGAWVLAHELAHQWFRWTSYVQASAALPVLIEGTADYLAYSWWRATFRAEDAERLALELFEGRLALARPFATVNVPVAPPSGMSDAEGRALVYGRPSAAWVAVEDAVGVAATRGALRAVHEAGRGANPTIDGVIAAVAAAVPEAAPVLDRWWRATDFEPRLPAS
jgi:hypothetical protein